MDAEKAILVRQIIESEKAALANRNSLTQAAMRAEYMSAVYSRNAPSALSQINLDRSLFAIGKAAASTERLMAEKITGEIFDIIGEVETPGMASSLLIYQGDIAKQLSRDARTISSLFRQIQVSLNGLSPNRYEAARARAMKVVNGPRTFTYKDKVGKVWNSDIYLKTHSSQYYYSLANDLVVGGMLAQGMVNAILDRPNHTTDGMVISLAKIDKSKYFHPGSQAILT